VLKWLRQYSKWIMVVGGSLLMIVFLLPAGGQWLQPNPMESAIGRVGDKEIRRVDLRRAGSELEVLRRLGARVPAADSLTWLLMMEEAGRMGIDVGEAEVNDALAQMNLQTEAALRAAAEEIEADPGYIRHVLGQYMKLQTYQLLMLGQASAPSARLSDPLVRRLVFDQSSLATVQYVEVSPARYASDEPVTEAQLTELFEQYKAVYEGEGEPYPFGYKLPDRVKFELLQVDADALRSAVMVDEKEALAYYDENKEAQFKNEATDEDSGEGPMGMDVPTLEETQQKYKPYREVRESIIRRLTRGKSEELGERVIKAARSMLIDDARRNLSKTGVFYDTQAAEDWQPMSLAKVAEKLAERFEIVVRVAPYDARWYTQQQVGEMSGLESVTVQIDDGPRLDEYLMTTRELDEERSTFGLQVDIPSLPLKSDGGAWYLLRVTDAASTREPQSLDEVRAQVTQDARKLRAYRAMIDDDNRQDLIDEAGRTSLGELARSLGSTVSTPSPFPRRRLVGYPPYMPYTYEVPFITGIDASETFVDTVFEHIAKLGGASGFEKATPSEQLLTIPLDNKLSLYVVKVEEFEPATISTLDTQRGSARAFQNEIIRAEGFAEIFSRESLIKRLDYVDLREQEEREADEDAEGEGADDADSAAKSA